MSPPQKELTTEELREIVVDLKIAQTQEKTTREQLETLISALETLLEKQHASDEIFSSLFSSLKNLIPFHLSVILRAPLPLEPIHKLIPLASNDSKLLNISWEKIDLFHRVFSGEIVNIFNIHFLKKWTALPTLQKIRSALFIPLKQSQTPAILLLLHQNIGVYSEKHRKIAQWFSSVFSQALVLLRGKIEIEKKNKLLVEKELQTRSLLKAIPDLVFKINREGYFLDYKAENIQNMAVKPEEFLGKNIFSVFPKKTATLHMNHIQHAFHTNKIETYEYEMTTLDGEKKIFEARMNKINNNELVLVSRNITNRKTLEKAMKLHSDIIEYMSEGILLIRKMDQKIISINPAIEKLLGYSKKELINQDATILRYFHSETQQNRPLIELFKQDESKQFSVECFQRNKKKRMCQIRISTFYHSNHQSVWILILEDIEKQKQLEMQLLQSQKLDAIGQFTGGIAHDFNNDLSVILFCTHQLLEETKHNSSIQKTLKTILKTTNQSSQIIKQLLSFSRKQILIEEQKDLKEIILGFQPLIQHMLPESILLKINLDPDLKKIKIDPNKFKQALLNLINNAKDAISGTGTISLSAQSMILSKPKITFQNTTIPPGSYVQLTLQDTGTGIAPENLPHLFEPFFTTKKAHQGTGLGLSMVYGFFKQSGGYIDIKSKKNKGTTFYLFFQALQKNHEFISEFSHKKPQPLLEKKVLFSKKTILLVEDNVMLREIFKEILEKKGFTLYATENGEKALQFLEKNPQKKFDLLLSDLVMPHMDGLELAQKIHERFLKIKIIFTSGYPKNITNIKLIEKLHAHFFTKPIDFCKFFQFLENIFSEKSNKND